MCDLISVTNRLWDFREVVHSSSSQDGAEWPEVRENWLSESHISLNGVLNFHLYFLYFLTDFGEIDVGGLLVRLLSSCFTKIVVVMLYLMT